MKKHKALLATTLLTGVLFAATACNTSGGFPGAQWPVVKAASLQGGVIHLASFEKGPESRVQFAMAYEHGKYARFRDGKRIAEVAYDTAIDGGDAISIHYEHTLKRMVEGWNFNRNKSITYGTRGSVQSGWDSISTAAYSLGTTHACVGFLYEWDHPAADSKNYPGKIAFGYMCEMQRQALTNAQILTFLDGLDIERLENGDALLPNNGNAATDTRVLASAQNGGDFDHQDFPFDYGFPFEESEGDNASN